MHNLTVKQLGLLKGKPINWSNLTGKQINLKKKRKNKCAMHVAWSYCQAAGLVAKRNTNQFKKEERKTNQLEQFNRKTNQFKKEEEKQILA